MDFLIHLLGIETPENTRLQSAELVLRGVGPIWLVILLVVALVGAALVVLFYSLEKGTMGWPRRLLMIGLRVLLICLVLLLLLRPVLLTEFQGERPRHIVLLLDNSQSMKLQDRRLTDADKMRVALAKGLVPLSTSVTAVKTASDIPADTPKDPQRADLVRWILTHKDLKLVAGLEKHGPVRPLLFGHAVHGTREEASKDKSVTERLLESFKAEEHRTGLADAVVDILQSKDGDLPAAIVALTDGQDNASKFSLQEAALECQRYKVPLHVYGVGSAEGGLLQLKEVVAPETIFVQDTLHLPLRWKAHGFKKGNLEISVTLGGKTMPLAHGGKDSLLKVELPLAVGEDLRDVVTFKVPQGKEKEENLDLAVTIQVKGSDQFKDTLTRSVRVVDKKIKVLYIENSPRFTYQFLQAAMLRDRRIEPSFLLVQADTKVAQSGPPFLSTFPPTREKFFDAKYNVIILGDVASTYLGKEHMEWIKEFVQNRGGLIAIAGRNHMPASYEKTPLEDVLPVEFSAHKFPLEADVRTQEYPVTLTDVGQRTDMLALADTPEDNLKEWGRLPGFHWHYPVNKLRPGALSLLVNPRAKMGDQPMPLLATQFYGKGQALFLGSDETWRWRFNEEAKITNRFWGQLIYQLGLPSLLGETSKRVQVALEHAQAVLNKPGSIFVRLVDKDFNPRKDATVEATLEYLDAKAGQERFRKVTLHAMPGRDGEYRALLEHDQPGRWELKINNPEPNTFQFRVELPPRHELEESGLAEKALREMAQLAGGAFYREEDLHRLASAVEPQRATFTRRQEAILWNPLAFVLFLGLITGEWLVRKFSDLS